MTGQSYGSSPQQHLIVAEEEATKYNLDTASYMVSLMQAAKERLNKTKRSNPNKKHSHLIDYSLSKGIKKFKLSKTCTKP